MVRPVHTQSLREAIREVALENTGFVYPGDPDLRGKIQESYSNKKPVQNKKTVASKVSGEKIESELEEFENREDRIDYRRDTNGYFFNLFQFSQYDNQISDDLQTFFDDDPIVPEKRIADHINKSSNIAEEDISYLLNQLKNNGLLEEIKASGSSFYLAGEDLEEGKPLANIEQELAREANDEGTVTRRAIENALELDVPDALVRKLQREGYLIKVDTEFWLPNEEDSIEEYTQSAVEDDIVPAIKELFRENDWIVNREEFREEIKRKLNESTGIIRELDPEDRKQVLNNVRQSVLDELTDGEDDEIEVKDLRNLVESSTSTTGRGNEASDHRFWNKKVEEKIQDEAQSLNDQRGDTDLRYFIENEVNNTMATNNDNPLVEQYYEEEIKEEVKRIAKR